MKNKLKLPETMIILGTGWDAFADEIETKKEISYKEWLGIESGVPGHQGKLIVGEKVALMKGRLHKYEGLSWEEVVGPIRLAYAAGVKRIVITSAVGALNPKYKVGDLVVLSDMLTLFLGESPLVGPEFVDLSEVFDREMREKALGVLKEEKISYQEGVYAYMRGPQFETPADKRTLLSLGADVVGMSTVPETIVARSLGMRVMGVSVVTNMAFVEHSHAEVLKEAKNASKKMVKALYGVI